MIILDVKIPGRDGWSVLAELKSDPLLAETPVIMTTIVDNRSMGFALGAADYLTKPIDQMRLAAVLRKFRCTTPPCLALVVEDHPESREILCRLLRQNGWRVIEAENGHVALERMRTMVPAVILLDLMLPEMDGFEFAKHLRDHEAWRSIPVIVITAMDLTAAQRSRLNGQVQRIHQKSAYRQEELLNEIRDLVASGTQAKT